MRNNFSFYKWPAVILLGIGAVIRVTALLQNHDLMVDEANVVRNIYERGFGGLAMPLSYQQFAPPVFLWMIKLCGLIGGYSELSMRVLPVLFSCVSLALIYAVSRKAGLRKALLLPLALNCFSLFIVRYAVDVKQYSLDMAVSLALLLMAQSIDVRKIPLRRFFLIWLLTGAAAVWVSMPAAFMCAGVFCYYLAPVLQDKSAKKLLSLAGIGIGWAASFGLYYALFLKDMIGSSYLQSFHTGYFLGPFPATSEDWNHRINLGKEIFRLSASGAEHIGWIRFSLLLLIAGTVALIRKGPANLFLFIVPVACLIAAATLKQYTLIPRVCMFIMPFLQIGIGAGAEQLGKWLPRPAGAMLWIACAAMIILNNAASILYEPIEIDELHKEIAFARRHFVRADRMLLDNIGQPVKIYYSTIHPNIRQRRTADSIATFLWETNMDSLCAAATERTAFFYFWVDDGVLSRHTKAMYANMQPLDSLIRPSYRAYVFAPK